MNQTVRVEARDSLGYPREREGLGKIESVYKTRRHVYDQYSKPTTNIKEMKK